MIESLRRITCDACGKEELVQGGPHAPKHPGSWLPVETQLWKGDVCGEECRMAVVNRSHELHAHSLKQMQDFIDDRKAKRREAICQPLGPGGF